MGGLVVIAASLPRIGRRLDPDVDILENG